MRTLALCLLLLLLVASPALGIDVTSGTCTVTQIGRVGAGIHAWDFDWASTSGGQVLATVTELNGEILRVLFDPDASTSAPTNLYDVTLTDAYGVDVLCGLGANRSSSTTQTKIPRIVTGDGTTSVPLPVATAGDLTLLIDNAGDDKGGHLVIFLRR